MKLRNRRHTIVSFLRLLLHNQNDSALQTCQNFPVGTEQDSRLLAAVLDSIQGIPPITTRQTQTQCIRFNNSSFFWKIQFLQNQPLWISYIQAFIIFFSLACKKYLSSPRLPRAGLISQQPCPQLQVLLQHANQYPRHWPLIWLRNVLYVAGISILYQVFCFRRMYIYRYSTFMHCTVHTGHCKQFF